MTRTNHRAALLAALATVLQVLESFFPHPIPGVRLGLANMITIVALVHEGFGPAMEIAVIRTIISSFMLGTFMTPSFILSFTSAIASTAVMGFMYFLFSRKNKPLLSVTGISLAGAVVHNLTQITLVYFVFIKHAGILMLIPVLGISAALTGWLNGLIASAICTKVDLGGKALHKAEHRHKGRALPQFRVPVIEKNLIAIPAEVKIILVTILGIAVVASENMIFYAAALLALPAAAFILRAGAANMFKAVRRMRYFILFSFLIPALFGGSGKVEFSMWFISITDEGVLDGLVYAMRIIILIFASSLVTATTSPDGLAQGIKNLLLPLGPGAGAFGRTLADAWSGLPDTWEACTGFIAGAFRDKDNKNITKLIDSIAGFVALLYVSYGTNKPAKKGATNE